MSLRTYVFRRSLYSIPLVFFVILFNFILIHSAPGDPVIYLYGHLDVSGEQMEIVREQMGLREPLYRQFLTYLSRILTGDLGYSFYFRQPVIELFAQGLPATLMLMFASILPATVIGVILGVIAARNARSRADYLISTLAIYGYSFPVFWGGMVSILIFSVWLGWFPAMGMTTLTAAQGKTGLDYYVDVLRHLFLPAIVLGMWYLASYVRFTRASMLEVLEKDYIVTARSKGLEENQILFKHALRNALLPVLTVMGLNLGMVFTGAVITETVFAWPGIGSLLQAGIVSRDYTLLMGGFLITAICVVFANLVTDCMYAILDPRITYK
jgi:peptide/nickel transport system permease protein